MSNTKSTDTINTNQSKVSQYSKETKETNCTKEQLEANSNLSTANNSPAQKPKKESILQAIAYIINEIIKENKDNHKYLTKEQKEVEKNDIFRGRKIPAITIENFLKRILKYTNLEETTLILSLIYLDRYCELTTIKLNEFNIHRLLLLSITSAIKYNEDDHYVNEFYAKVGGISKDEYNFLEFGYLKGIEYSLFVTDEVYEKYDNYLQKFNNEM